MNKYIFTLFLFTITGAASPGLHAHNNSPQDRAQKQQTLDLACQRARENKIAPLRQAEIDDCVERRRRDPEYCQRYHRDFGEKSGQQAALFYDLPECITAFKYQKSYRNSGK
ncbi:hypothetical protein [Motilimonas pumila]|uniref:Uncharacterized protein n=1 Tax=Motilimonas pumila TaxID=2303987 RepID=A0A418YE87_9GAMM|nr:hypothetical protein [Motilimonas pumila]RJG47453.1 hypothetical protein D1Z90_11110 [Motilimonas pumila]